VLPFDEYAREGFASTLERYGLWREFTIDGKRTGGTCTRIVRHALDAGSALRPLDTLPEVICNQLLTPTMSLRDKARLAAAYARGIHSHVWFNLFMNNLRTAFAMDWYARRWHGAALAEKARLMRELALSGGLRVCFDVYGLRRLWRMDGRIVAREHVSLPVGEFEAWHLAGTAIRIDNPSHRRELHVWVSDDARRLPLVAMGVIDLGAVRATLNAYYRPGEASAKAQGKESLKW